MKASDLKAGELYAITVPADNNWVVSESGGYHYLSNLARSSGRYIICAKVLSNEMHGVYIGNDPDFAPIRYKAVPVAQWPNVPRWEQKGIPMSVRYENSEDGDPAKDKWTEKAVIIWARSILYPWKGSEDEAIDEAHRKIVRHNVLRNQERNRIERLAREEEAAVKQRMSYLAEALFPGLDLSVTTTSYIRDKNLGGEEFFLAYRKLFFAMSTEKEVRVSQDDDLKFSDEELGGLTRVARLITAGDDEPCTIVRAQGRTILTSEPDLSRLVNFAVGHCMASGWKEEDLQEVHPFDLVVEFTKTPEGAALLREKGIICNEVAATRDVILGEDELYDAFDQALTVATKLTTAKPIK
jgi:hypothetical protein